MFQKGIPKRVILYYNYIILNYKEVYLSDYILDFSLTTEQDRCTAISSICSQTTYTPKQYTQMADYILLANKQNNIYPEEFHSPHISHDIQSLDELMDDPIQCDIIENSAQSISRSIYYKPKRLINRKNPLFSSIPGIQELWKTIDLYKEKLQQNPSDWHLKRLYISLCQQQYSLLDAAIPPQYPLPHPKPRKQFFEWYKGVLLENGQYANLDLTNPSHMAKFLIHLPSLIEYCDDMETDLYELISDTKQAIAASKLTSLQQDVLHLYQCGATCKQMQDFIFTHHNRKISQSYSAIILYNQVAPKVSTEYSEIYYSRLYRNNPSKWRICLCCKQKKLLTKHNFHHFSSKPNGFSLICKECVAKKKENKNGK